MKSKSLITASIAMMLGHTSTFAQAELLKLQNTKSHDRRQKKSPFNTQQEQERRLKQLARVQS